MTIGTSGSRPAIPPITAINGSARTNPVRADLAGATRGVIDRSVPGTAGPCDGQRRRSSSRRPTENLPSGSTRVHMAVVVTPTRLLVLAIGVLALPALAAPDAAEQAYQAARKGYYALKKDPKRRKFRDSWLTVAPLRGSREEVPQEPAWAGRAVHRCPAPL